MTGEGFRTGFGGTVDVAVVDRLVAAAQEQGRLDPGLGRRIRLMARLLMGRLVSGEALAEAVGISRAAVHKHTAALRAAGVVVESAPGAGYQVRSWEDLLVPETVLPLLLGAAGAQSPGGDRSRGDEPPAPGLPLLGLPYLYAPVVDSTNVWLKDRAPQGLADGAVAVTDHQVGGRGRLGRSWVSEPGKDLTFSVLLRPRVIPGHAARFVLAAALAVVETVSALGLEDRVGIKWPNDVLVGGRKVCGILSEVAMDMDRLHWVVVGIGLNVNGRPGESIPPNDLPPGRPRPISLVECLGSRTARGPLFVDLLGRLEARFRQVEEGKWPDVLAACAAHDLLLGRQVAVRVGAAGDTARVVEAPMAASSAAEGIGAGYGPEGELLLRQADGSLRRLIAGEVSMS